MGPFTNDIFEAEQKHYVTLYVIADYDSGELAIREPNKCSRWDWFSWSALPNPLFVPVANLVKTGFTPPK
jgi:8-oxo-dGTP diphosphatase